MKYLILAFSLTSALCFRSMNFAHAETLTVGGATNATVVLPEGLNTILKAIVEEQPSKGRVRVPLSQSRLMQLQTDLRRQGYRFALKEIQASVDLASVYLRENPDVAAFLRKVSSGTGHRSTIFGNVAEFAEARERGMVLTKSPTSQTWDLTELRTGPRNAQIKVYQDPVAGIRSAIDDVSGMAGKMGGRRAHVLMPHDTLVAGVEKGLLVRRIHDVYVPTSGEKVTFLPMKSVLSAQEARVYTETGSEILQRLAPRVSPRIGGITPSLSRSARYPASYPNAARTASVRRVLLPERNIASSLTSFKPGALAAAGTVIVDSGIASYQFIYQGETNKTEFAEELQDAVARSAAVGVAVQLVYVFVATPSGLVLAGVAVTTYLVADKLIEHLREECQGRVITVDELQGIAPADFLASVPRELWDITGTRSMGNE